MCIQDLLNINPYSLKSEAKNNLLNKELLSFELSKNKYASKLIQLLFLKVDTLL